MGSQKSVQQIITERDQALSDLNSVERSLSDLFRRYENMKTVLEGFKKVTTSHTDKEINVNFRVNHSVLVSLFICLL